MRHVDKSFQNSQLFIRYYEITIKYRLNEFIGSRFNYFKIVLKYNYLFLLKFKIVKYFSSSETVIFNHCTNNFIIIIVSLISIINIKIKNNIKSI